MKNVKKILSLLSALFLFAVSFVFTATGGAVFSDVPENAPYYGAVENLSEICELGYGDGTFRPDAEITRAEFTAMLLKVFKKDDLANAKSDQIFVDVPVSGWANKYITAGYDLGIINGYGEGVFKPEQEIKIEETVKMAVSFLLEKHTGGIEYPEGYMKIADGLGLTVFGYTGNTNALRWQVAVILNNAVNADEAKLTELKEKCTLSGAYNSRVSGGGGGGSGGSASVSADAATAWASSDSMPAPEFGGVPSKMPEPSFDSAAPVPMPTLMPSPTPKMPEPPFDDVEIIPLPTAIPSPTPDGDVPPRQNEQINPGTLTAGEWNDNTNWEFWQRLMSNREWNTLQSKWGISWKRYIIHVSDGENPVRNAQVALYEGGVPLWSAVTDKNGDALVFADTIDEQSNAFSLKVTVGNAQKDIEPVVLTSDKPFEVYLAGNGFEPLDFSETAADTVDVMFMIDTTGSMGDELQYINGELSDVIERVGTDVRISCNFYRDIDDEYIVRPFPFTDSVYEAVGQISKQFAAGGGDYPEAVELALLNGIDEHEWNEDAKERIMFLVLDAPPHYDGERAEKMRECVKKAAAKGIRIIPVASSGVDKETEFLLRSLSIATNGDYIFLTDHSGIGNSHIEPTIGEYEVQFLNDLLVKVITDRL